MSTCHIQQQSILSVILVLPSFLMIINYIIINTIKSPNDSLFLSCILSTSHRCLKPPQDLIAITLVILNSRSRRFIIIHIKNLLKVIRSASRTPISNNPKQNGVSVILNLDIFIHPDLANKIQRLNAKTFTNTMSQTHSPSYIGQTYHLTHVTNIVLRIKRLDLTWTLTTTRNIRAFVHPVHSGLSIHGPVRPHSRFCGADSRDSYTG
uniref:C5 protein n=1 Tax=Malvastrum yellow vein Honghe virus TaxID=676044 RepID=A0A6G7MB86_9GEMI|nr:C5 protein [Malvastrum yellow vein Honghe virus]QIJ32387.1 C5 protein [Malvastrum yellow vein Honghe virus]QIJ32396.1 C5 protein [Malvastrum yellow vein Honghe virus]